MQPAEDIIKLNQLLKEYAESAGIIYLDYHSVLKNENNGLSAEYAPDGVHPTLSCYKIMENMVFEVLSKR
jgi:lysophospholipase L1-like esterase